MDTNIGSRAVVWGTIGTDVMVVCFELRHMIIFSFVLIMADLWWGFCETRKRYGEAKAERNTILMERYKWRHSRAIRRTTNKIIDYTTYLVVGALFGLAIFEPMDVCGHVVSAAIALMIGCACEVASIIGHVYYVKFGIEVKAKDIWDWVVSLFVNIVKVKNQDLGEAIDHTIGNNYDKEQNMED